METRVPMILVTPIPELVYIPTIALIVPMEITVPKTIIARMDVAYLVVRKTAQMVICVPTIIAMPTPECANMSTTLLLVLMAMPVPWVMFVLVERAVLEMPRFAMTGTDVLPILAMPPVIVYILLTMNIVLMVMLVR